MLAGDAGGEVREELFETLADYDDGILEHLVEGRQPTTATARVQRVITARRDQTLGFQSKEGCQGWDEVQAYMPVAMLHDLIIEIRALSNGMGFFTREFDHLIELSGREAETAIAERQAAHGRIYSITV